MRFGVCWLRWSEDPSNVLVLYSNGRCVTDMLIVKDCFCFFDCFYGLYGIELTIHFSFWPSLWRMAHKHAGIQYARMLVLFVPMQQNVLGHWKMKILSGPPFLTWSSTWKFSKIIGHRFGSPMFLHCVTTRFHGAKNTVVQILGWRNYTSNSLLLAKVPKCNEWNVNWAMKKPDCLGYYMGESATQWCEGLGIGINHTNPGSALNSAKPWPECCSSLQDLSTLEIPSTLFGPQRWRFHHISISCTIQVWYIYLCEWLGFYGKCRVNIPVPWMLWV